MGIFTNNSFRLQHLPANEGNLVQL